MSVEGRAVALPHGFCLDETAFDRKCLASGFFFVSHG